MLFCLVAFRANIDLVMERSLAYNHSFEVYIASHTDLPASIHNVNNTHVINTVIVANDPADYSRNLYNQRTINDLMSSMGHSHIQLLRLVFTEENIQMWELLRFLIQDNILHKVDMLHLAVYIGMVFVFMFYLFIMSQFLLLLCSILL